MTGELQELRKPAGFDAPDRASFVTVVPDGRAC
jgi:hypothetical protein